MVNTRLSEVIGPEYPLPIFCRHDRDNFFSERVVGQGAPSVTKPSRIGPRHWFQLPELLLIPFASVDAKKRVKMREKNVFTVF
jgi:hypothetical protein